jgi:hypothetical protein
MKKILKSLIVRFSRFLLVHPMLKRTLVLLLNRFPSVKNRLKLISFQYGNETFDYFRPRTIDDLSPRAVQILCDLKHTLNKKQ